MKKSLVMVLALAGTVLVSCTQSEYVGEAVQTSKNEAITFGGSTGKMVRAEKGGLDAAKLLNKEMLVFGSKGDGTDYSTVFNSYIVRYDDSKSGNDEYNNGWYYVGETAKDGTTSQNIKYWDYSTTDYRFVAGSPVSAFTYKLGSTGDIAKATVTGLGGHIARNTGTANTWAPVYIADPKVVAKSDYNSSVKFTFRTMQSKVRVGIYETIPGYSISSIKFYKTTPATAAAAPTPSHTALKRIRSRSWVHTGKAVTSLPASLPPTPQLQLQISMAQTTIWTPRLATS